MSRRHQVHEPMEDISPTASDASSPADANNFPMDRKKATHLRCERQRREAINSGYSELKDLIPPSASFANIKTTNSSILFRAVDYMQELNSKLEADEKELSQLNAQAVALELIAQQYEKMESDVSATPNNIETKMLQILLEDCFESFEQQVDFTSYATITRTLLTWVEGLSVTNKDFKTTAGKMITAPFTNP